MRDELSAKTYFWPYDVFGYLLPGLAVLASFGNSNAWGTALLGGMWTRLRVGDVALLLGLSYVLGHVVAGMSSLVFEKWIVSGILKWPTTHMFREGSEGRASRLLLPSYRRPYSREFRDTFDSLFSEVFRMSPGDPHDRFWLVWAYVAIRHPVAYRRGTHFLELYGFSRNMSFALLLIAGFPFLPAWSSPTDEAWWVSGAVLAAGFLFVNYTKLLRRLNDEVYRAFVAIGRGD